MLDVDSRPGLLTRPQAGAVRVRADITGNCAVGRWQPEQPLGIAGRNPAPVVGS